jgi:hypothetical protein
VYLSTPSGISRGMRQNFKRKSVHYTTTGCNTAIFWDIASCSRDVNRRFEGMYHLHFQGRKSAEQETSWLAPCATLCFIAWLIFDHRVTFRSNKPFGSLSRFESAERSNREDVQCTLRRIYSGKYYYYYYYYYYN